MTHRHPDWSAPASKDRLTCLVCPRACTLRDGQRGLCFVRRRDGQRIICDTYGRSTGFCIDPIEKKPLNHFLPGTSVLSFGTAGCNMTCRFCQNHAISQARRVDALCDDAAPDQIAAAAQRHGCRSVAVTYNEPTIFIEYAIDTAVACHERDVHTVVVTNGYITAAAREALYPHVDAVNVDLKAFDDRFYRQLCGTGMTEVLETIDWLVNHTAVWVELTTLIIPTHNDDPGMLARQADWLLAHGCANVPLHVTGFHPDAKLLDIPPTPVATLQRARRLFLDAGLRFVYVGNRPDDEGSRTRCPACDRLLIERAGYDLTRWNLGDGGRCACGAVIPGRFEPQPGRWGNRRQRVVLSATS